METRKPTNFPAISNNDNTEKIEITTSLILARCLQNNIFINDLSEFTIMDVIEILNVYITDDKKSKEKSKGNNVKMATQKDIDEFF